MDPERRYWQQRYDEAAAAFTEDWRVGRWTTPHYYAMVQERLGRLVGPFSGKGLRVLDVCCGSGAFIEQLNERGFRGVGADHSTGALKRLKQHPARATLPVLAADACRLPFPNAAFDLVLSVGMLQCLDEADEYLKELSRVLTGAGRLLLLFSPDSWLVNRRKRLAAAYGDPDMAHYTLHKTARLTELLRALGFNRVDASYLYYVFYASLLRPLLRLLNRRLPHARLLAPFATSAVVLASRYGGFRYASPTLRSCIVCGRRVGGMERSGMEPTGNT